MYQDVSAMDVFNYMEPAIWCGLIAAAVTFAIEIKLMLKGVLFGGGRRKLEAAKKAGRMVTGTRTYCNRSIRRANNKSGSEIWYHAGYTYTLNGKTKEKRIVKKNAKPPWKVTLYYKEGSERVFLADDVDGSPLEIVIYIIPLLVGVGVMMAMGYEPGPPFV